VHIPMRHALSSAHRVMNHLAAIAAGSVMAGTVAMAGYFALASPPPSTPLVVLTDLEPDDMLALKVLHSRKMRPSAIIVGEGCTRAKLARARLYAHQLGWRDTLIVQGVGSSKTFPDEGSDLDPLAVALVEGALPPIQRTDAEPKTETETEAVRWDVRLKAVLQHNVSGGTGVQKPTILCLKPPRELVCAEAGAGPDGAAALFGPVRLVLYGSFNLREVSYGSVLHWLKPDTTPYNQVLWYENFGGMAGKTTNLNPDTIPEGDRSTPPSKGWFDECLRAVAASWDAFILKDCEDTCAAIEAANPLWRDDPAAVASWDRNDTCATSVRKHAGRQIVAADPVLALVFDNPMFSQYSRAVENVVLPAGSPYPVVTFSEEDDGNPRMKVIQYKALPDARVLASLGPVWAEAFSTNSES